MLGAVFIRTQGETGSGKGWLWEECGVVNVLIMLQPGMRLAKNSPQLVEIYSNTSAGVRFAGLVCVGRFQVVEVGQRCSAVTKYPS